MTYAQDIRSWESDQRRPPFWNVSGETIPAYAVMQVTGRRTGVTGGTILECSKPDGTGTVYAANGQFEVINDKPGRCTLDWPAAVLATDTGEVGPVNGSFIMTNAGSGWQTIGAATSGRNLVAKLSVGIQEIIKGKVVVATIAWGGTGQIEIHIDDTPQGTPYLTVWHNWFDEPNAISVGIKVAAHFYRNESKWRIMHADCET